MNVTFLIGNGFDMRMGLDTSFRAVEDYYRQLKNKSDNISRFQKELTVNGDYWSDFEKAMGEHTASFSEDDQGLYKERIADFTDEMARYLAQQEERIDFDICKEAIQNEFKRSITGFYGELTRRYQREVDNIFKQYAEQVTINFISFNYTTILDRCLKYSFSKDSVVGNHAKGGSGYNHYVNNAVLHVHGTLPGPLVMGVDGADQIANQTWAKQRRFCEGVVKPITNRRAGNLVDDDALSLINNSPIICIFGMSLGVTDRSWWVNIGKALKNDGRKLVIFTNSRNGNTDGAAQFLQFDVENERRDRFFDLAGIQGEERNKMEEKISVVPGSKLFQVNLVSLTSKRKDDDILENLLGTTQAGKELAGTTV